LRNINLNRGGLFVLGSMHSEMSGLSVSPHRCRCTINSRLLC
jgi:hypothetical protein